MKEKTCIGITKKSWEKLIRTAAAVQAKQVIVLPPEAVPPKESKKLRRRVKAARDLHLESGVIWHSSGVSVPAIASWIGIIYVVLNETGYRYRLLAVDAHGRRSLFAVPIRMLDKIDALPSMGYSAAEVKLLRLVADEVSGHQAVREYRIAVPHPAKKDIERQRNQWCEDLDRTFLLKILCNRAWLLPVAAAALDVHLRSFKLFRDGPLFAYNFIAHSGDMQADENFLAALQALNFSSAPSFMGMAVPEIILRDKEDLNAWRSFPDRLVLLRTATGSLLTPLFDEIDERERLRYCGGVLPPRLQTVPIVRSKTIFHRRFAADTTLPKGEKALTSAEQDTLRSAMRIALNRKVAQVVYDQWRSQMASATAYRIDPFAAWREMLEITFLTILFANEATLFAQALRLLTDTQFRHEQVEQERTQKIKEALELISTPSRYEGEITDRPDSKAAVRQYLDEDQNAVAFRFSPVRGPDIGRVFLAFTRTSLQRLLARVGCGAELLDAVLNAAEKSGLLDQRGRTVKLGKEALPFITFCA